MKLTIRYKEKAWWEDYPSSKYLNSEDKIFLNYWGSVEEFQEVFPYDFLISARKIYLYNGLQIFKNWIDTGVWKYIEFNSPVNSYDFIKRV